MLSTWDYAVIAIYLVGVAAFGIRAGGKQASTRDYFLGDRNLPWWAVCFSVVATETSTLTVISVPGIAYGGMLTFLQLTFGYLLGRVVVSLVLLPRYFQGELVTAYAYLGQRFGDGMRQAASVTFLITRLLADGVRLFATAIPLKLIADAAGIETSYFQIILLIGLITIAYTYIGGIKAVVWMDVVQMLLYVGGAAFAILLLAGDLPEGWWSRAVEAGKTTVFNWEGVGSLDAWLTQPYFFLTAVIGGAFLSMASHGTDQLIVQRLLTCRTLQDGQKALIGSGVVIFVQFALFLAVGLLLWAYYDAQSPAALGLSRTDEIFPKYIIEQMPAGVAGLLLAGILAAAMSTLSSSLNSLASSSMMDLYERLVRKPRSEAEGLWLARAFTLGWGLVFIVFANLFESQNNPVVELGLAIAGYTYGGLLGAFLLGLMNRRAQQREAVIAFLVTVISMVLIIFGVWYSPDAGWQVVFNPSKAYVAEQGLVRIAWPWYTLIGVGINLAVGSLLALRHRGSHA